MIFDACPLAEWLKNNPVVQSPGSTPSAESSHEAQSISDLDAIVSFECYDSIWDWPTELHSCRMVGMFHDAIPFRIDEKDDPSRYYRAAGKMASRAHLIFCDSEASHRDLTTFFPGTAAKSCVLYLGHDRDRFLPEPQAGGDPRISGKRGTPGPTIAMIGALEPRKNQSGVLRACRYFHSSADGDRIRLLLIGCRPEHHPYRFLEEQARKSVDIVYTGYLPDEELADSQAVRPVPVPIPLGRVRHSDSRSHDGRCRGGHVQSIVDARGRREFRLLLRSTRSSVDRLHGQNALGLDSEDRVRLIGSAREWASSFTWDTMTRRLQDRVLSMLDCPTIGSVPEEEQRQDRFDWSRYRARTEIDV